MLRKALDAATPNLRVIAREARVSYHAIRLYRAGIRTPSPAVLHRLSVALERQGYRLAGFARELETASKRHSPGGRKG